MPRRIMMILYVLMALVLVYFLFAVILWLTQNKLIFFPTRALHATPAQVGIPFTDVTIPVNNAERVHAWYCEGDETSKVVLFCHGNGGNIGHRLDHIAVLRSLGVGVFIFDYRGYGQSDGSPSVKRALEDTRAVYRHLVDSLKVAPNRIILFGESIGGGFATQLATESPCGGLVLESSFTSLTKMGEEAMPWLPLSIFPALGLETMENLRSVRVPVLVTHSPDDDIVPFAMGRALFDAAHEPKRFVSLSGGHNDRLYLNDGEYLNGWRWIIDGEHASPKQGALGLNAMRHRP